MSSSNCCYLTCIQLFQEAGQVVWYFHLLKNFPQFVEIHTVKGFGIVNKAVDVFLKLSLFRWSNRCWQFDLWFLCLGLNPASTSGISQFTYCWSLAWRILSITLLVDEMSAIVWCFEHSLALPFFGIGMKADLLSPPTAPLAPRALAWVLFCPPDTETGPGARHPVPAARPPLLRGEVSELEVSCSRLSLLSGLCEVKWALGSITPNKASGGDGIPFELFQILKDDAVKVLHSICQQIWKTQQWPQD